VWLLAVICALIGLFVAVFDLGDKAFMDPLEWFILGILISLIQPGPLPFARRQS
jgi:hypothetical protein